MEEQNEYIYHVDTFMLYREANRDSHPNFDKYYVESLHNFKFKGRDIFDRNEIKMRLNYILSKINVTPEDEQLYKTMMKILNKVNNNMLKEDPNSKSENSLKSTIEALTSITYSKMDHFVKLVELIVEKSLDESTFCTIYAIICCELGKYYIENVNQPKLLFRHVLLNNCQTTFSKFITNCDKVEKSKFIGLMKFLGELYNKKMLSSIIIQGCFDKLGNVIDKSPYVADAICELVNTTIKNISQEKSKDIFNHFELKLKEYIEQNKNSIKIKFSLQNALDSIIKIKSNNNFV